MNRKKLLLFILLLVFGMSLVYSYISMPRQKTIESATPPRTGKPSSPRAAKPERVDEYRVRLDLLDATEGRFYGFRKNVFRPLYSVENKVPPTRPLPPLKQAVKAPPPSPTVPQPPLPPSAQPSMAQRDMAKFTFVGFLKKDKKKTIFLSKDKEIFLVSKGDKVEGKYEATTITDEALTIKVLADGSEIVIPLVENRQLSAAGR